MKNHQGGRKNRRDNSEGAAAEGAGRECSTEGAIAVKRGASSHHGGLLYRIPSAQIPLRLICYVPQGALAPISNQNSSLPWIPAFPRL